MSIDSNTNNPPIFPPLSNTPISQPDALLTPSTTSPAGPSDSTAAAPPSSTSANLTISLPQPTSSELQSLDWGKFLMLIWTTTSAQRQQSYKEEVPSAHQRGMHVYGMTEAAELAKLFADIEKYIEYVQRIRTEQQQINQMIQNMNVKLEQITDKMNEAIDKHNKGEMNDNDFRRAVNSYNSQKQNLMVQYQNTIDNANQQLSSLNGEIDQANALSKDWDIGSISHAENIQSTLNLPNVTVATTELIQTPALIPLINVNATMPDVIKLTQKLYEERIENFVNSMKLISQAQHATDNIRESHFALLKLIFPNMSVGQLTDLAGGASVSSSIISMTVGSIQAILNKAVFQSLVAKENVESSDVLLNQLQLSALLELTQASLFSVLGVNPKTGDNQAVVANVAVNFASYISKLLSSDALDKMMQDFSTEHHLSKKDAAALKAAFSQTLWTIAVSNLAHATGMYGLPTQLLGNLPAFNTASADETPLDLKDYFANPVERKKFEEQLINLMVMKNRTSLEAARIIADNIVGALQLLDNASPEEIHKALVKQLGTSFDSSFSNTLASAGLVTLLNSRLDSELNGHPVYLSNLLLEGSQYLNTVNNQQSPFTLESIQKDKFVNSLAAQLTSPSLSLADATIDANTIWESVRKNQKFSSINDFYNSIAQSISSTVGITPDAASKIARGTDLGIGNVPLSPLLNPGKTEILSPDDLAASFKAQLILFYTSHGMSPSEAEKQSETATSALIVNPHSLPNVMLEIDEDFKKADIQNSNELWVETYREDSVTSRELAAFIASTTVNPLLYSQLVTITGGTQGGEFELPIQG